MTKSVKKTKARVAAEIPIASKFRGRKLLMFLVMAVVVVGGYFAYTGFASSPEIASGRSGYCLDDNSDGTSNGNKVDIYTCNGSLAQHWTVNGSYVQINGKCLDAKGWGKTNGTLIDLWTCNGGANQKWNFIGSGTHTELMNVNAGKCLDDTGWGGNGTQLELYTCNGQANQVWYVSSYASSTNSGSSCSSGWHASAGCAQTYAKSKFSSYGWDPQWPVYLNGGPYSPYGKGWYTRYNCLVDTWNYESGWQWHAANASGAYGIPQALPGSKMSSAGSDWYNNAYTQVRWGLGYIKSTYGDPCGALQQEMNHGWY